MEIQSYRREGSAAHTARQPALDPETLQASEGLEAGKFGCEMYASKDPWGLNLTAPLARPQANCLLALCPAFF